MKLRLLLWAMFVLLAGLITLVPAAAQDDFIFGLILVGPQNDGGWSQAHYEGGKYVEANVPGSKMLVFEKLNVVDSPEATLESVTQDMVDQGAKLIFTTSDDFEEDTTAIAKKPKFADVTFINVSGDDVYTGEAPANLGNLMGTMEWGKIIAGCAAALNTQTGSIGYLGPLINFETRRLASSAYLGARYCYEKYVGGNPDNLKFNVTWIGFWFNIPGVTLDPSEETNAFFDGGSDVVISGIDTTEAIVVAGQRAKEGQVVWAIPYDSETACTIAPDVCLGSPYYHWGPSYAKIVSAVKDGTYKQSWDLANPDWKDLNNPDTTGIGFKNGTALTEKAATSLASFIDEAAAFATNPANKDSIFLWQGPMSYQDGTPIVVDDGASLPYIAKLGVSPSIWYLDQLLGGMTGASVTKQ
ncbi:MAG: BMP family ABC transporter substrate-binding protein [Chloroflexota bacterium]